MSSITRWGGGLTLCLLFSTVAAADEFSPSNDEVDKELDQSLDDEYGEKDRPTDHPHPHDTPDGPASDDDDHDRFGLRLGMMATVLYSELYDVKISHRNGSSGGLEIELADLDDDSDSDSYEFEDVSGNYKVWIDLGQHISLVGGYRHVRFNDTTTLAPGGSGTFTYGNTTFGTLDQVESSFELLTADLDLVFKPINNRFITIELAVGTRYVQWKTELQRVGGNFESESETVEALLPMVGVGLALRPVEELTFFGRFRIGHFSYDRDQEFYWDDDDDEWEEIEAKDKEATSFELDLGMSLVFDDTFGFIVGYRLDAIEVERETDSRGESAEGRSHGAYAGLILQF